ncbi:hypothetical protein J4734_23795 [Klebsiella pneumoniae]|uniref:Uncharacterized protein n=1 Tax=Klebsiella pneumoniae TaxID=573 RepID=A0A939SVQ7_KLEPN|nr:hypothetical protein [Klebsiella pneumoniae]
MGIEVVPFSTKLKQAESEALVGHIAPGCPVRCDRTGLAENTPDARAVSLQRMAGALPSEPLTRSVPLTATIR